MTLRDIDWNPVYESTPVGEPTLVESFYQPVLSEGTRYDRLAGYLSLKSLSDALDGIDTVIQTDGTVRIIAGCELNPDDQDILLSDDSDPLPASKRSKLALVAQLLSEDRLQVKIAIPSHGDVGIFHPKLGIVHDSEDNTLTFEGSVNETPSAWRHNYERFKVHRSWNEVEKKYTDTDVDTFQALWNDNHDAVDVFNLSDAAEKRLITWKPETDDALKHHVETVKEHQNSAYVTEGLAATTLSHAGRSTGGLHVAEDISPIDPWPHQRVISDTAVSIYPNNLLFCDEVGLGKTIEAGLTVSRLFQTGQAETALFLVPAGLVRQWQEELRDNFNIHAHRYERTSGGDHEFISPSGQTVTVSGSTPAESWSQSPVAEFLKTADRPTPVIVSWHTARRGDNAGLVSPSRAQSDKSPVWDVSVLDEAHSGREGTNLHDLFTCVNQDSECLYALTATPMQLDVGELYDLLRLCDIPDEWDDKQRFSRFFKTRRTLSDLLNEDTPSSPVYDGFNQVAADLADELGLEAPELGQDRLEEFARLLNSHLSSHEGYSEEVTTAIDSADVSLSSKRTLRKLLGETSHGGVFDTPTDLVSKCGRSELKTLADVGEWATPVKTRVFRNTRQILRKSHQLGLLDEHVPFRNVTTRRIQMGEAKSLYEDVEEYISEIYKKSQQELTGRQKIALGFVMTTYRQRLTSSIHAAKQSLLRRYQTLTSDRPADTPTNRSFRDSLVSLSEEPFATEATVQSVLKWSIDEYVPTGHSDDPSDIIGAEINALEELIPQLELAPNDPKLQRLERDINKFRRDAKDKIIIFTQYTDTLDAIKNHVTKTHSQVGTYTGSTGQLYDSETGEWVTIGKESVKQSFADEDGDTNILICTDSASEGLNLQTGDALINYDLPWNPMRVEQRIGRIDRIGQQNKIVQVINYAYEDSVEGDIYEALDQRLNLFEDVVGTMRPVLNGLEEDIGNAAMSSSTIDPSHLADTAEQRNKQAKEAASEAGLLSDETIDEQSIVEETKLDGWEGFTHPALANVGDDERRFKPYNVPALSEELLAHANSSWEFRTLLQQEREPHGFGMSDVYILKNPPSEYSSHQLQSSDEDETTIQASLSSEGEVAVTFDPSVSKEYPSLVLLLPGHPLFHSVLDDISPDSINQHLVYGTSESTGRYVASESDAYPDVVEPYAPQENTLPNGEVLPSEDEAKDQVSRWCELHRLTNNY